MKTRQSTGSAQSMAKKANWKSERKEKGPDENLYVHRIQVIFVPRLQFSIPGLDERTKFSFRDRTFVR